MGSLLRLATFFTDVPAEEEQWQAPSMLPRCEHCRSCIRACPTGAIAADRFLLHTERCLVFHNERPGATAFPDWIPPSSHVCLVGCMKCQETCPENACFLDRVVEEGEFGDDDTAALLDGVSLENLPADLRQRLERSDLLCLYGILSRNLRAALAAGEAPGQPAPR
jgi:epoxyqueuosine reductase